ncbi:MAG: ribosomal-processing cysteine protease Prp [Spirochaetes bacterium]|nr:ribosomal-processing cysteine protease Prp [Spirochaetota bacterium]
MGPDPDLVHIYVSLDGEGVVRRVRAEGHAGSTAAGGNLICAAVTVLLRSLFESWFRYPRLVLEGQAPESGVLGFDLKQYEAAQTTALRASGDVLLTGLAGLQREYPDALDLVIESKGGTYAT